MADRMRSDRQGRALGAWSRHSLAHHHGFGMMVGIPSQVKRVEAWPLPVEAVGFTLLPMGRQGD